MLYPTELRPRVRLYLFVSESMASQSQLRASDGSDVSGSASPPGVVGAERLQTTHGATAR
ncbi:MAG: hypothetical protein ACON39_06355 [Coraliomargaritaceae bacterium]